MRDHSTPRPVARATFVGLALLSTLAVAAGGPGQEDGTDIRRAVAQRRDTLARHAGPGYYNGPDFYPTAVDASQVSVRFERGTGEDEVRSFLAGFAEVDLDALATAPIGEQGWTAAPLIDGLGEEDVLDVARRIDAAPETVYGMPSLWRTGERLGLTNRLLVSFEKHVTPFDVGALLARHELTVVEVLDYVEHGFVLELPKASGRLALDVSRTIYEEGDSLWALPEFVVERELRLTPNDQFFKYQWHLNATSFHSSWGIKVDADVDAVEAWNVTPGGSTSITVAIIDDGVEYTHPDLTGNDVPGWDYLGGDSTPLPGSGDDHGTAVAGVACADGNNSIGVTGIAYNCKFMPIRLVGFGQTTTKEANAISYAKNNGADVMNNSWGPPDGTGASYPLPANVKSAIDDAVANGRGGLGCVIFWAAGNGNESADLDGYAAYTNVVSVAASTDQDKRASYSDFGNSVDVCAPSSGGPGFGIVTVDRSGSAGYASGSYAVGFGGTSAASPLAAGVGALILSVNPNLTFSDVYGVLTTTADAIDVAGGGYDGSGHSTLYGYGKVNAYQAVLAAPSWGGPPPPPPPPPGGYTHFDSTDVPKTIPDAGGGGIFSTLTVSGMSGTTTDYDVNVNILHTYKGDLLVYLQRPDGQYILMHNRTGGGTDDINTTYDTQTTPYQPLSNLNGADPNGAWRLWAFDQAAQDTGSISAWSMDLQTNGSGGGGGPSTTLYSATDVPKAIPDNNPTGVTSTMTVSDPNSSITDVNVSVNITHTYKGDLIVSLIAPDGTTVLLHNRTGGSTDNVITTYDTLTTPAQSLSAFNGKNPSGQWKLKVQDMANLDVGNLNVWSVQLTTQ